MGKVWKEGKGERGKRQRKKGKGEEKGKRKGKKGKGKARKREGKRYNIVRGK